MIITTSNNKINILSLTVTQKLYEQFFESNELDFDQMFL